MKTFNTAGMKKLNKDDQDKYTRAQNSPAALIIAKRAPHVVWRGPLPLTCLSRILTLPHLGASLVSSPSLSRLCLCR